MFPSFSFLVFPFVSIFFPRQSFFGDGSKKKSAWERAQRIRTASAGCAQDARGTPKRLVKVISRVFMAEMGLGWSVPGAQGTLSRPLFFTGGSFFSAGFTGCRITPKMGLLQRASFFSSLGYETSRERVCLPTEGSKQRRTSKRGERCCLETLHCDTLGGRQDVCGKRAHSLHLKNGGAAIQAKKNTLSEHTRAVRVRPAHQTHTHVNTGRSVARRVAESRAHWRTCPQCVFLWKLSRTRR